ncbi:MAG: signal recognition particle protein Srp19, partial [Desulfurococcaceae archaeon]
DEIVLVIDASLGQQAFNIAKKFHSTTPIGSIVVTKLDGTAKGGGALSAVVATNARIKFIGTGEKLDELEVFNPSRFIARILGIGDIESLVERVKRIQVEFTEKDIEDLMSGRINMRLIYKQLINIRKLGPFKKILQLIPGLGLKIPFEVDPRKLEEKVSKWISAINSMTYEELDNPDIIDKNRVKRIAIGSGVDQENVRELIKQYNMLKKITRELKKRKDILRKLREMGFQTDSIE